MLRQIQGNDIGIVFQEPMTSLNPVKRIGWQVEESLRIHMPEMGKEERYRRVIRALEDVELVFVQKISARAFRRYAAARDDRLRNDL